MESSKVNALLSLYFEGETSLAQEQQLRMYFTGGQVAPYLDEYVVLFSAFAKAESQTFDAPVNLPTKRFKIPAWVQIAAIAAVTFGIFFQINSLNNNKVKGTYANNPEKAIKITQNVFGVMNQMISQGTSQIGVVKTFDKTANDLVK